MDTTEHDVYICYRDPAGRPLADLVSAGLARRGFHVIPHGVSAGAGGLERRLALIEEAPDFVLLLTPGALAPSADEHDPFRAEVAHALKTARIIVPVIAPGFGVYPVRGLAADLAGLARFQGIVHDPTNTPEMIARLAHALSSDTTVDDRRVMRTARRAFIAAGLFVAAIIIVKLAIALPKMLARRTELPPMPPLSLYWSSFAERQQDGGWSEFPLRDGGTVAPGDHLRLVFSPSADGCAYVLTKNVRGEIAVLFPPQELRGAARVTSGRVYEAPANAGWVTIDPQAGLTALYIVASYDPIENLEELVEEPAQGLSIQARRELLTTTIAGLIDGRHGPSDFKVRARNGRAILRSLAPPPGPASSTARLSSGAVALHSLAPEAGLLSALVEIRVQPDAGRPNPAR
jgi:hypothetical protein